MGAGLAGARAAAGAAVGGTCVPLLPLLEPPLPGAPGAVPDVGRAASAGRARAALPPVVAATVTVAGAGERRPPVRCSASTCALGPSNATAATGAADAGIADGAPLLPFSPRTACARSCAARNLPVEKAAPQPSLRQNRLGGAGAAAARAGASRTGAGTAAAGFAGARAGAAAVVAGGGAAATTAGGGVSRRTASAAPTPGAAATAGAAPAAGAAAALGPPCGRHALREYLARPAASTSRIMASNSSPSVSTSAARIVCV